MITNQTFVYTPLHTVEGLPDLFALSPEQTLLRWFNYHLKEAGSSRRVRNFGQDIKDSECYTILLNQIANSIRGVNMSPMKVNLCVSVLNVQLYRITK